MKLVSLITACNGISNHELFTFTYFPRYYFLPSHWLREREKVGRWQCFDVNVCTSNQYHNTDHNLYHSNKLQHKIYDVQKGQHSYVDKMSSALLALVRTFMYIHTINQLISMMRWSCRFPKSNEWVISFAHSSHIHLFIEQKRNIIVYFVLYLAQLIFKNNSNVHDVNKQSRNTYNCYPLKLRLRII